MSLFAGDCVELRALLLSYGVEISAYNDKANKQLTQYILTEYPNRQVTCTAQTGWMGKCFVLPDAVIGADSDKYAYQAEGGGAGAYACRGSLGGWRDSVAKLAVGNPILALAISAAFAGSLLRGLNAHSRGLHYWGDSSRGKSTALYAACSVWGGDRYCRSWRATANGLEAAGNLFNDALLALDEISECNPKDVGEVVYLLGNGQGKARADRTGHARPVTRFRVFVLSNGEVPISTAMEEAGRRAKAGQSVRLLDIRATTRTYGAFDTLHGYGNGAALAGAINKAVTEHCGYAGREFIARLVADDQSQIASQLETTKAHPHFSRGDDGQLRRAAETLAICALAGELATSYGITGWAVGEATKAALVGLDLWHAGRGNTGSAETAQILDQVSRFIELHGDSRFSAKGDNTGNTIRDRAGWWMFDDAGVTKLYLLNKAGLAEAVRGFDLRRAIEALISVGAMARAESGKSSQTHKIAGVVHRLYAIDPSKLTEGVRHE
jgi:putative DNA primase/helicase